MSQFFPFFSLLEEEAFFYLLEKKPYMSAKVADRSNISGQLKETSGMKAYKGPPSRGGRIHNARFASWQPQFYLYSHLSLSISQSVFGSRPTNHPASTVNMYIS